MVHKLCSSKAEMQSIFFLAEMGVSLNGGTPNLHPKMIHFYSENPMGLLGKGTTILGFTPKLEIRFKMIYPLVN